MILSKIVSVNFIESLNSFLSLKKNIHGVANVVILTLAS